MERTTSLSTTSMESDNFGLNFIQIILFIFLIYRHFKIIFGIQLQSIKCFRLQKNIWVKLIFIKYDFMLCRYYSILGISKIMLFCLMILNYFKKYHHFPNIAKYGSGSEKCFKVFEEKGEINKLVYLPFFLCFTHRQ